MKKGTKFLFTIVFFCAFVSQTSAQAVLKNGKIPKDLIITLSLSGSVQFANYYIYTIHSDGKFFYEEISNLLPQKSFSTLLGIKTKSIKLKKLNLKNKLSKDQIKGMIFEFENSEFFQMNELYYGDPTLKEQLCVNHAYTKSLSISTNGKAKSVAFFLGCSYGENSPLKKFLSLYDKIEKDISGVKKTKIDEIVQTKRSIGERE